MNNRTFYPTVLAVAVSLALVGCGGGGGGSTEKSPVVTTPPVVDPGEPTNPTEPGTPTNPENPTNPTNPENPTNPTEPKPPVDSYNPADYDVATPNTSANKVKIGIMDSGVENNKYLDHSVQAVMRYIEDYQAGKITITDLTKAGIDVQDIDPNKHGTIVAHIIAAKYGANSGVNDGLAADIAQLYGISSSEDSGRFGTSSAFYQAALDLNKKHGVKLFNGSYGGFYDDNESYKAKVTQYAVQLAKGGSLVVMATGNDGFNQPSSESLLPKENHEIEKGWLAVTGVDSTGKALYRDEQGKGANACGDAAAWCLAGDYVTGPIKSPTSDKNVMFVGTSGATPQVTSAAALVWSAFPWMTAEQVRQTVLTNADYIDDGSGLDQLYNKTFGWGKLDIDGSVKGPQSFLSNWGNDNFDANVDSGLSVFANDINGDAGLVKNGKGALALTGHSTYLGETIVNTGKLQVTGSIKSDVEVGPLGLLSGKGSVGAVQNNGAVSTEDGRLTVNGEYIQASTATLTYRLNNHLTVNGEAVLDGSLVVTAKDRNLVTKGDHLVIDAESVVGNFTNTVTTSAFLAVKGAVVGQDGQVKVAVDFADAAVAGTRVGGISEASGLLTNKLMDKANEQALNGQETAVTRYVTGLQQATTQAQAQAVLNSNSGALFAETPSVLLRNDSLVNAQIAQRTRQVTKQGQSGVWASAGYLETANEASGWDKVQSDIFSTTVGADFKIGENAALGAFVTDYKEESNYDASNGSSETEMLSFGLYGKFTNPDLYYVSATAQYGVGESEFNRKVTNIDSTEDSLSKADLDKFGVYAELGQEIVKGQFGLTPYIGLSHNQVSMDALKESSDLGVSVGDLTAKETKALAGFRADYKLTSNLDFGGYLEYAYAFDRKLPTVYLASNVASDLVVGYEAPEFEKDFLMYGLSFNYQTANKNWNVFGDVAGNAMNEDEIQVQLGLKYAF